jgi:hypothetical protein
VRLNASAVIASLRRDKAMSERNKTVTTRKKTPFIWVLLILPYLALCFPSLYARVTPELFGFPFFYWYQFVWVVATSMLLWVVYRSLKD